MGMTTATLTVSTVDDGTDELDGTITATVETGMGYTVAVAPGNSAVVTVTDDDEPSGEHQRSQCVGGRGCGCYLHGDGRLRLRRAT